jgi:hypothetical protein
MDHQEAVLGRAAERYLLGELAGSEREAFEEHYFVCAECADALSDGAKLAENARAVFRERELLKREASAGIWWQLKSWISAHPMLPVAASVALILFTAYLEFVKVPRLRNQLASATSPQPVLAFALHAASRGAAQTIVVPKGAKFYTIFVDLPEAHAPAFVCEIRNASGNVRALLGVPKSETSDTLNLLLEASRTPPGQYTLVVRTREARSSEIGRYNFTLEFE